MALEHVAVPGVYVVLFSFLAIFRVEITLVSLVYIRYQDLFEYTCIFEISRILDIYDPIVRNRPVCKNLSMSNSERNCMSYIWAGVIDCRSAKPTSWL